MSLLVLTRCEALYATRSFTWVETGKPFEDSRIPHLSMKYIGTEYANIKGGFVHLFEVQ